MLSESCKALRPLLLLAASTPALAQYVSTPPPGAAPPPGTGEVTSLPRTASRSNSNGPTVTPVTTGQ